MVVVVVVVNVVVVTVVVIVGFVVVVGFVTSVVIVAACVVLLLLLLFLQWTNIDTHKQTHTHRAPPLLLQAYTDALAINCTANMIMIQQYNNTSPL